MQANLLAFRRVYARLPTLIPLASRPLGRRRVGVRLLFGGRALTGVRRDPGAEGHDRIERRLRLVELRRMAAPLEDEARHGGGRARFDGADLLQGSVLIVRALDDERGNAP